MSIAPLIQDIAIVRSSLESINAGQELEQPIVNFFIILLRKVVEQVLQIFARVSLSVSDSRFFLRSSPAI